MLKILLPIILPTNISCSRFFADTIEVINSGNDVPKAIIVSEIILSLKPIIFAMSDALLTTKSLPIIIPNNPITTNIKDLNNLNCGFLSTDWFLLCLAKAIK